ncbi:hypothetical protein SAMN03159338_1119 [Sphingomonas sp. NFR04]|uniref:hypothetical protein n=1 Tax=Sphingomonas sp. NFR04 TaxID=1566283 RepID=UPI0008E3A448|nr:hypothetical protein [Sphingomonas sp. NFR04]SFJ22448.1 hypothetical protein SAMN03159338_1119 [Sphingomonas sp. NFR04]
MIDVTRRSAVGGLLIGSFAPAACSGAASSADRGAPGGRGNGLRPGRNWNGTAGSGGTARAQSDVPRGTLVPDERFIGGFSAAPGQWVHGEGMRITALGLPPQSANSSEINYFKEAVFYLEGNTVTVTDWSVNQTPVRMYDGRMAPQGSIGFAVEIGAGEGPVTAGDAILYCYLRGEHGLERRIELPLVINVDRSLDAKRPTRYVDPVDGDDSAAGTQAAPWKTIARGLANRGVGDGGLLILARAGRYVEDLNRVPGMGPIDNARVIEVKPADGLRPDQMVITRTNRYLPDARWSISARRVHFHGVTVDMSKFPRIMGVPGTQVGFFGCQLLDRERMYGERNAAGRSIGLNLFKGDPRQRDILPPLPYLGHGFYLMETLFEGAAPMAPRLYRNVTAKLTTDSFQGGPGYDDVVIDGYDATIGEPAPIRLHLPPTLTVESVAREGQGHTAITVRDAGGLSPMKKIWDLQVRIVTGAGAGPKPYQLFLADPVTRRIVVEGDLAGTLSPGDEIMCYAIFHVDFMQQGGVQRPNQRGMRNTTVFRYHAEGPTAQLFLTQGGVRLLPNSVITTDGTAFRIASPSGQNEILPDDILQLQGGAQPGEYRFVKSFDAATGSGVLLEPFSRDQTNAPVERAKTMTDFVMALSTLRKTGHGSEMGQFQHGHRNFLLAHNTFISEPNCLTFRSKLPGHGHRNHVQLFNLCTRIGADLPELPGWGLRIEHAHLLRGSPRGKFCRVREVALSFGERQRYQPSRDIARIGRKPLIPFDSFGNPVDADSPVGSLSV